MLSEFEIRNKFLFYISYKIFKKIKKNLNFINMVNFYLFSKKVVKILFYIYIYIYIYIYNFSLLEYSLKYKV